jgi:16S rRNA (cytosine967-C5)-methyltransferase
VSGKRRCAVPLRRLAFKALKRIDQAGAYSSFLSSSPDFLSLSGLDRNLAMELVLGTLRRQGTLDRILSEYRRELDALDPDVRILLRMGVYQLLFLDRIPAYAVLWESVELCREVVGFAPAGLLNAVLRKLQRDINVWKERLAQFPEQESEQAAWLSLPRWLWLRWVERIGIQRARRWAEAASLPPRIDFRLPFAGDREPDLLRQLSRSKPLQQADSLPGAYSYLSRPRQGPEAERGEAVYFQSLASQCIGWLLPLQPGDEILDLCAAPGGKTLILAERTGSRGRVIAMDLHRHRFKALTKSLNRHQIKNTLCVVGDSTRPLPFVRKWRNILLDAPCSGLGTLGRNPEIRWRVQPQDLLRMRNLQLKLLSNAADYLADGGRLLYSTCSTEPEENEEVVGTFLAERQNFRREDLDTIGAAGAFVSTDGFFRTFPDYPDEDGFFAALLVKQGV